ncbi:UDP-glucose 4-epimerase GalE [Aquibium carbonis]|uniref:UDP-glucose 4-epimerase n=1 Tax=Aquibium carbonis TaxID=2495581 RepID=A0A429YXN5_9HYPH|nr:UDP-glucose 4-epimerase GalE [Aquibium carbonis]RST86228.1 UDP-glucose 4-epimerase GalE [Aquibium carbonis]
MATVLVVGGAGYIGAHCCLDLAGKGHVPVVYDNLSSGHETFVQWGPLEIGDLHDRDRLRDVIARHRPEAIIHFAALSEVGVSLLDPLAFYDNNVGGTISLLSAATEAGIDKLVFSSTCATYGVPETSPMAEDHRQAPINPYGHGKLMVETILADLDRLRGFRSAVLRYFNAAGADEDGRIGEWHEPETHAIPIAIEAAMGRRAGFTVNGTDYDTRDGTCVRDFVHVMDLADAHTRALEHLLGGGASAAVNLGTGTGTSLNELLAVVRAVSGRDFPVSFGPRRAGDAPSLVADNRKARALLGWAPGRSLEDIVASAWRWHSGRNAG